MDRRVGCGFDAHPLVDGRPLVLGGVNIDYERGLAGHSDADVLTHAVIDALLGSLCLGDIGTHFPPDDPQWENSNSVELLGEVITLLAGSGWEVGNIDATVVAQQPKLAPYREKMTANLAKACRVPSGQVSVKATTTEGLGFTGRGEGIVAHAVAMVVNNNKS